MNRRKFIAAMATVAVLPSVVASVVAQPTAVPAIGPVTRTFSVIRLVPKATDTGTEFELKLLQQVRFKDLLREDIVVIKEPLDDWARLCGYNCIQQICSKDFLREDILIDDKPLDDGEVGRLYLVKSEQFKVKSEQHGVEAVFVLSVEPYKSPDGNWKAYGGKKSPSA